MRVSLPGATQRSPLPRDPDPQPPPERALRQPPTPRPPIGDASGQSRCRPPVSQARSAGGWSSALEELGRCTASGRGALGRRALTGVGERPERRPEAGGSWRPSLRHSSRVRRAVVVCLRSLCAPASGKGAYGAGALWGWDQEVSQSR